MKKTVKNPTQRKSTGVRRREIALAVLQLIGKRGASSLTAATIAESVGVTPGALFRHFRSVDEILSAAVDLAIELVEETFPDEELEPLERLQQIVLARIATIRGTPGLAWLLLSDQVFLSVPAPAVKRLRQLVKRSRAFVLQALVDGVEDGELRDDIDPAVMLVLFTGCVHALAGSKGVHGKGAAAAPPPAEEVIEILVELLGA